MWMLNMKRMEVRWLSFNKRNWCSYERLTDGVLNWHHPREPILSSNRGISNTPRFWQIYSDFSFNMGPRARVLVWRTSFPCSLAQSHCKLFNLLLAPHFQINVQISNRWWWIWMARSTILAISEWFGELRKQLNQIDKSIILMKKLITSKWEPHIFKSVFALLCPEMWMARNRLTALHSSLEGQTYSQVKKQWSHHNSPRDKLCIPLQRDTTKRSLKLLKDKMRHIKNIEFWAKVDWTLAVPNHKWLGALHRQELRETFTEKRQK